MRKFAAIDLSIDPLREYRKNYRRSETKPSGGSVVMMLISLFVGAFCYTFNRRLCNKMFGIIILFVDCLSVGG